MVVVPCLTERDRGEPGEVSGLTTGAERRAAEEVAQRVDAEGRMVQEEDADRAAPEQPGQAADKGAAQQHAEAEGEREPCERPEWERAADEPQIRVGLQVARIAPGIGHVLA